jgi:MATE family multidrug resistance protein
MMSITSGLFIFLPETLLRFYSQDSTLLAVGVPLLRIAGLFQLVDGAQIVLTGMLRGLGNTKSSLYANLVSHWFLGFPLGYYFAFSTTLGAMGLWIGLCIGLSAVAGTLLFVWKRSYINSKISPH